MIPIAVELRRQRANREASLNILVACLGTMDIGRVAVLSGAVISALPQGILAMLKFSSPPIQGPGQAVPELSQLSRQKHCVQIKTAIQLTIPEYQNGYGGTTIGALHLPTSSGAFC